jgi:hypothetical protein
VVHRQDLRGEGGAGQEGGEGIRGERENSTKGFSYTLHFSTCHTML